MNHKDDHKTHLKINYTIIIRNSTYIILNN